MGPVVRLRGQRRADLRQGLELDPGRLLPHPDHRRVPGGPDPLGGRRRTRTCCASGAAVSTRKSASTTCATATASWSGRSSSSRAAFTRWTTRSSWKTSAIEAVENVRRLRHRASLALWCGNNEMEWGWVDWGWKGPEYQDLKAAYDRFFHHTLPEWCAAEDPDTPTGPARRRRIPRSRLPTARCRAMRTIGMSGTAASRSPLTATSTRAS